MARPKEELDLPEGWQGKITALYIQGASDVEIKAYIYNVRGSMSNDLWNRWLAEESEFSETIKKGRMLSEAWWSKEGRINLSQKEFNYTGWYMNMKNRFGWKDTQEIKHDVTRSFINLDPLDDTTDHGAKENSPS